MKRQNINYGQAGIIVIAVAAIVCSVAIFTPSFAQKSKHKPEKKETTTTNSDKQDTTTTTTTTTKSTTKVKIITIDSNGNKKVTDKVIHNDGDGDVAVSYSDDNFSVDVDHAMKAIAEASKEIAEAFANSDSRKMDKEMERARREIADARKEVDAVDWDEIRDAINKGLAEADRQLNDPKLREQIDYEIKQGLKEGERALAEAKKHITTHNISMSISGNGDEQVTASAGANGLTDYNEMLDKMEDEGLINRRRGFSISKKNHTLVINGERQPDDVYDRYRAYLHAKKIAISGSKHNLSISVNN